MVIFQACSADLFQPDREYCSCVWETCIMGYKAFFEKKNSLGITPKDYGQGLHWFTINLAGINFLTIETICSKYFPRKQKDGIDVVLVSSLLI